jgi:hypothetical protein
MMAGAAAAWRVTARPGTIVGVNDSSPANRKPDGESA